jgi:2-oxo-4-hydroxy-4-carboxy-5-ureidoimidazoline decarboxylase
MNQTEVSLDIAALNAMNQDEFVAAIGSTFEHSPWVAESAWSARPFQSLEALHGAMLDVVRRSPQLVRLGFLRAHPELAGREAQAGTMTDDSVREQRSAGLDMLTGAEFAELSRLNGEYRNRHGFPFIIAARRHTKDQIFAELRRRVFQDTESELAEALEQIGIITRLRLRSLLGSQSGYAQ